MANNMALSGLWEMLYIPKIVFTIDGSIVMWRGVPSAKGMGHKLVVVQHPIPTRC